MLPVKYEYWQSEEDGQWYFHLKVVRGGILVHSGAFLTEEECLDGIEKVRRYADVAIVVQPDVEPYY